MRWYELDPTVYMAISMIEMEDLSRQLECAKLILNEIDQIEENYIIKNMLALSEAQIHPNNRWYDKNELISKAFDYLKEIPKDIQRTISADILAYLRPAA